MIIGPFTNASGNGRDLRIAVVPRDVVARRTPIAFIPANRSTSALHDPAVGRGRSLFNLKRASSETTGFPFETKHWCVCQTSRDERLTQPPLRLWPIRGSSW